LKPVALFFFCGPFPSEPPFQVSNPLFGIDFLFYFSSGALVPRMNFPPPPNVLSGIFPLRLVWGLTGAFPTTTSPSCYLSFPSIRTIFLSPLCPVPVSIYKSSLKHMYIYSSCFQPFNLCMNLTFFPRSFCFPAFLRIVFSAPFDSPPISRPPGTGAALPIFPWFFQPPPYPDLYLLLLGVPPSVPPFFLDHNFPFFSLFPRCEPAIETLLDAH